MYADILQGALLSLSKCMSEGQAILVGLKKEMKGRKLYTGILCTVYILQGMSEGRAILVGLK